MQHRHFVRCNRPICGKISLNQPDQTYPKPNTFYENSFSCPDSPTRFVCGASSLAMMPYCRHNLFTRAEIRFLYSAGRKARSAYRALYRETRCGKCSCKNGMNIFPEHGFRKSGIAATESAPAFAAARTTLSRSLGESVIPGRTGAQFTLV